MNRTLILFVPLALMLSTACSGTDALDPAQFESRRDAARCAFLERCESPDRHAAEEDTYGPCESWSGADAEVDALYLAAVERGTLRLGPDAEACLEAMEDPAVPCAEAAACAHAYEGLVEEGGACRFDTECVEGTHCEFRACPGTCRKDKPEGATCLFPNECASGDCDWQLEACAAPLAAIGEPCQVGSDCESRRCVGASFWSGDDGACAEPLGAGGACDSSLDCAPYLACTFGTCSDRSESFVLEEGDACGRFFGAFCAHGLVCAFDDPAGQFAGVCAQPVGSGEACTPAFPDPCPSGEYCDVDVRRCLPRPGDGEPCGAGGASAIGYMSGWQETCAAGHACRDGVCLRQGLTGDACGSDFECEQGPCTAGTCDAPACLYEWF